MRESTISSEDTEARHSTPEARSQKEGAAACQQGRRTREPQASEKRNPDKQSGEEPKPPPAKEKSEKEKEDSKDRKEVER